MSNDTPTQRFDAQPPVGGEKRKSRLPLILGIIGGVLLVLVIILLILLLGPKGTPTAAGTTSPIPTSTASDSPSPAPTPTPAPTQVVVPTPTAAPPVNHNVTITGYSISPTKIDCSASAPANAQNLSISWHSINGKTAYFGVATNDAQSGGMGWILPPNGNQHNFPSGYDPYQYQCGNASQTYTITIVGPTGKVSKTVKIFRK
ncbi:MAG: hypothetical protein QOD50_835 [Actinomycetota bacterium]|jgi:hypothetical protein|nr:hypothetical protein [Actinomycetota bacterium]